jgi:hypothetical protein
MPELGARFMKQEVWQVIHSLPPDKASGLDRFTTRFLQAVWDIINLEIMSAFNAFWYLDSRSFHEINGALLVLLPMKSEATSIKDYRPTSLIHVLGKLFSKVLTNRLAPRLDELVHVSQNAFIKGHFIQDSFKLVRVAAKALHSKKKASS